MTTLGERIGCTHHLRSCFVRTQMDSIKNYVKEVIPFALTDTRSLRGVLRNVFELRKFINNIQPDIVHAQYGSMTALITLMATYRKFPLVISFCGNDLIEYLPSNILEKLHIKLAIIFSIFCSRYANGIIVKSKNLYNMLPKTVRHIAYILPNGVDMNHFRPMPKIAARKLLGLDPGSHIILFNKGGEGNDTIKCPQLAYESFSLLKEKLNNAVFVEIGNKPYEIMPLYLNASDLLLLTSANEGSSNIVKEAMACNLPVVSVECGDVADRLKKVTPSCIVSRNPKLLADAMATILLSKQRSNGNEIIKQQGLDIETIAQKLIEIYSNILRNKK